MVLFPGIFVVILCSAIIFFKVKEKSNVQIQKKKKKKKKKKLNKKEQKISIEIRKSVPIINSKSAYPFESNICFIS